VRLLRAWEMLNRAESRCGRLSRRSAGRDKGSHRHDEMEAGRGIWIFSSTRRMWDFSSMAQELGIMRRVV